PPNGLDPVNGIVGAYAYTGGYANAMLVPHNRAPPPRGSPAGPTLFSPPWNSFQFTSDGGFDATCPRWSAPKTAQTTRPIPAAPAGFTPVPYLIGDTPAMAMARAKFAAAQAEHAAEFVRIRAGVL